MLALKATMDYYGTWILVPRLADANIVMCKWVFTLKYHLDGTIAHKKAYLLTRSFIQAYGINYTKKFLSLSNSTPFTCSSLSLPIMPSLSTS